MIDKGEGILQGVDAVIDKDKSSAKLAKDLEADMLVILTAAEKVYINFNKDNQQGLDFMNLKDASKYINEGQDVYKRQTIYTVSQLVVFWIFIDKHEIDLVKSRYQEIINLSNSCLLYTSRCV